MKSCVEIGKGVLRQAVPGRIRTNAKAFSSAVMEVCCTQCGWIAAWGTGMALLHNIVEPVLNNPTPHKSVMIVGLWATMGLMFAKHQVLEVTNRNLSLGHRRCSNYQLNRHAR